MTSYFYSGVIWGLVVSGNSFVFIFILMILPRGDLRRSHKTFLECFHFLLILDSVHVPWFRLNPPDKGLNAYVSSYAALSFTLPSSFLLAPCHLISPFPLHLSRTLELSPLASYFQLCSTISSCSHMFFHANFQLSTLFVSPEGNWVFSKA